MKYLIGLLLGLTLHADILILEEAIGHGYPVFTKTGVAIDSKGMFKDDEIISYESYISTKCKSYKLININYNTKYGNNIVIDCIREK